MQQRANAIAAEQTRRADGIRQRLDTELADATPKRCKAAKADLEALKPDAAERHGPAPRWKPPPPPPEALAEARDRETKARTRWPRPQTR